MISVAIDGPAGSGKGTVSKRLAQECNLTYIDTGAMYRAVALLSLRNKVEISDEKGIVELARNAEIEFKDGKTYLNGENVEENIRSMEVTSIVSPISSIVPLRHILVKKQQDMAKTKDVIMEGRDITTVVLPEATYKIYLDASIDERAKRRYKENTQKRMTTSLEEIRESITKRDYNDMNKPYGALVRTPEQIYVDSTNMTIDEVVECIKNIITERK